MTKTQLIRKYRHISQIRNLPNSKIVAQSKKGFSAEILIRDGKYKIRLDYYGISPKIYIVEPEIDMSDFIHIHTFGKKYHYAYKKEIPQLCLTYYDTDKWNSSISLLESYIPWAIEWTEFYEIWLVTGFWYGGGVHPTLNKKKKK